MCGRHLSTNGTIFEEVGRNVEAEFAPLVRWPIIRSDHASHSLLLLPQSDQAKHCLFDARLVGDVAVDLFKKLKRQLDEKAARIQFEITRRNVSIFQKPQRVSLLVIAMAAAPE